MATWLIPPLHLWSPPWTLLLRTMSPHPVPARPPPSREASPTPGSAPCWHFSPRGSPHPIRLLMAHLWGMEVNGSFPGEEVLSTGTKLLEHAPHKRGTWYVLCMVSDRIKPRIISLQEKGVPPKSQRDSMVPWLCGWQPGVSSCGRPHMEVREGGWVRLSPGGYCPQWPCQ